MQKQDAIGTPIAPKSPATFRLSSYNCNGLRVPTLEAELRQLQDMEIDLQCFSEPNLDTLQISVRQHLYTALTKVDQHAKAVWTSSNLPSAKTAYKPGGASMICFTPTAGRILKSGRDPLGRWTWQLLNAKGNKQILIMSVYRATSSGRANINSAYNQQAKLLAAQGSTDPDPEASFRTDLLHFLHQQRATSTAHLHFLILGDWNETPSGQQVASQLCDQFSLTDYWSDLHPTCPDFGTHVQGSTRIDFILGSMSLLHAITGFTYEPFSYRTRGDHRAFFVDFDTRQLFGATDPVLPSPAGRALNSKDSKSVTAYLTALCKYLDEHSVFSRLNQAMRSADPSAIESIDHDITRACLYAEKQCRRPRPGFWSIKLHDLRRTLSIWKQLHCKKRRGQDCTPLLTRAVSFGIDIPQDIPADDVHARVTSLRHDLKQCIQESAAHRDAMLLDHARIAHHDGKIPKANILTQLRSQEAKIRAYTRLRFARGKTQSSQGIQRLEVPIAWPTPQDPPPTPDTRLVDPKSLKRPDQWREVTTPSDIEFYLKLRNRRHFGQAETDGTPFTQPPLSTQFPWDGMSPQATAVLDGSFSDPALPHATSTLLAQLKATAALNNIPANVTPEDFRRKFTKWTEETSTSPSGRHLGHYKALFRAPDPNLSEDDTEQVKGIQTKLTHMYIQVINFALRHSYSLHRWNNVTNMMIYKETGNVKIHRLRVIHLYEADWNFLMGLKWNQAIRRARQDGTLSSGQYGGCPGRDCQTITLMEELRLDYSQLTRTPFANFDNDAASCYDRILMPLSSLAARGYGIHQNITQLHASTLSTALFRLKVSAQVSASGYRHCPEFPIHGTGQGSGNSPMIWCFISSKLFQAHASQAHGMTFTSPDGTQSLFMSIIGFVDDSTCITASDPTAPITALVTKMRSDSQLWNDLLWASGGKLELPKCGFHIIYYTFDPSGRPNLVTKYEGDVFLEDAQSQRIQVHAKSVGQPRRNLGHYKAPSSQYHTQASVLRATAKEISRAIVSCRFSKPIARLMYDSVLRPALEYAIPQSFLTPKQLTTIERIYRRPILQSCGYKATTARCLVQAPKSLAGAGIPEITSVDGTEKTIHFLKHWRTPHEDCGRLLHILQAWTQLYCGVSFPILHEPGIHLPHITGRFIPAVRQYLRSVGGHIDLLDPYVPPPLRANDTALMDVAIHSPLSPSTVQCINFARLHLRVTYLSEICNIQGTHIRPSILRGAMDSVYIPTRKYPHQPRPSNPTWAKFRTFLQSFTRPGSKTLLPDFILGHWLPTHSTMGTWHSYSTPSSHSVCRFSNTSWHHYTTAGSVPLLQHTTPDFHPTSISHPIATSLSTTGDLTVYPSPVPQPPQATPASTTWSAFLATKPAWAQALLANIEFHTDIATIRSTQSAFNHLIVVSDGSGKDDVMAFAWVVASPTEKLVTGSAQCPGSQCSFRAEAAGQLAATLFLAYLQEFGDFDITGPHLFCDNKEVGNRGAAHTRYDKPYPNVTLTPQFDLTEQIFQIVQASHLRPAFKHVKGHQDDQAGATLSWEAELNVLVDELADTRRRQLTPDYTVPPVPACPAVLYLSDKAITTNYRSQLLSAYSRPRYFNYVQERFRWTPEVFSSINWPAYESAVQRFTHTPTLVKLCHRILPTNATLKKWNYQTAASCPLCPEPETFAHMLQCTHPSRVKWKRDCIGLLRKSLPPCGFDHTRLDCLCSSLTEYLDTGSVTTTTYPVSYHPAIHAQNLIGWEHAFMGRLTTLWVTVSSPSDQLEPTRGGSQLAAQLISAAKTLWLQRNKDAHGTTTTSTLYRDRLTTQVSALLALRPKVRPCDDFLFPRDHQDFLQKSTDDELASFIASTTQAIHNSVQRAESSTLPDTGAIYNYFQPVRQGALNTIRRTQRQATMHRNNMRFHQLPRSASRHRANNTPLTQFTPPAASPAPAQNTHQAPISRFFRPS